ncbi:MAG: YigZ family protein [Alteromonadaceae bacterium]|nr:YigZ family protein [Alteromonadaceae bacterium]
MSYFEPVSGSQAELIVKKSRFISFARKVTERNQALTYAEELKKRYPDSRHICWGYMIGDPSNSTNAGCNDDGEPSGTAGKPILTQINYSNVGNVVVCVVRYFGGIRLGAGGLVRAYRESANLALAALKVSEFVPQQECVITTTFEHENAVRQTLLNMNGEVIQCHYGRFVELHVVLPIPHLDEVESTLKSYQSHLKRL